MQSMLWEVWRTSSEGVAVSITETKLKIQRSNPMAGSVVAHLYSATQRQREGQSRYGEPGVAGSALYYLKLSLPFSDLGSSRPDPSLSQMSATMLTLGMS